MGVAVRIKQSTKIGDCGLNMAYGPHFANSGIEVKKIMGFGHT